MAGMGGSVVIFKANESGKENDSYCDILQENGFHVLKVPVLDFEYINLGELRTKLKNPQNYSGIIFSSPRCVKGCELAVDKESFQEVFEKWGKHYNFAVGETTAQKAGYLGLNCQGKESGNGDALADIIVKSHFEKPFLYPVGSLSGENFKLKLKRANIEVDNITVYITKPHPDLEASIEDLMGSITPPVYFLYFSPSGIKFTLPILKKLNFDLKIIKFVAIGPSTEKEMKANGIEIYSTAKKPTPEFVLQAFNNGILCVRR